MSLRERVLDALIDGELGRGLIVTRQDLMHYFAKENPATTGVLLSHSESDFGALQRPTHSQFTRRVAEGVYRISPAALAARMQERNLAF
jgi:hypothetical protein